MLFEFIKEDRDDYDLTLLPHIGVKGDMKKHQYIIPL